jgi:D-3-phosphoglycerate dehydrogenase / 2-oxoglutarate reductase
MRPPIVTYTDGTVLLAPGIEFLRSHDVEVAILPSGLDSREVAERSRGSLALIVHEVPIGRKVIERLEGTRVIVRAGAGYDVVDLEAATEHGIQVTNVPDYCMDEVADHTLLLLLALSRSLSSMESEAWAGSWKYRETLPGVHRLQGRRLGILGLGRVGRAVARRALTFGWEVVATDALADEAGFEAPAGVSMVELDELFATSHAVTLHCPLSKATHHLVDRERLASMREDVILINTSRGGLVDLGAVKAALAEGRLGGVGVDVVEDEPEPELDPLFRSHPRVIVTPHVAWYSLESRRDLAIGAAAEALRVIRGEPVKHPVNRLP